MSIILSIFLGIVIKIKEACYNINAETRNYMKQKQIQQIGILFTLCLIISFLFLMICSKASFLYPLNEWMDANCFFTIGRGMLHGKVYYVDLFDQKGPLLYFYHTIAALFSETTFIGVFLIEVISFAFFLYYAYQLLHLYLKREIAFFALPIISFLILTLPAFSHGDSAEEFCLPFLMYSLYSLIKYLRSNQSLPSKSMLFMNGIMAGCVMTIKFSMLGFWFAFMMCLFFMIAMKKAYKEAIISCFIFLLGMSLPLIPWILYFTYHGALNTFFESYIYFNIHYYPAHSPFLLKIIMIIAKPIRFFAQNPGIGLPLVIGFTTLSFDQIILKKRSHKLIILTTFFFLCLGVFAGGVSFRYYYLILTPFLILGLISLGTWIQAYYPRFLHKNVDALFIIMTTLLLYFTFYGSKNTTMIKGTVNQEDLVQYQFAKIINQTKNPTLLNYQFLDGGFYLASNILPSNRYFQKLNIPDDIYPDNINDQNHMIRHKKVDFVVTRTMINRYTKDTTTKYLKQNYKEVFRMNQEYEEKRYRYILWQKK